MAYQTILRGPALPLIGTSLTVRDAFNERIPVRFRIMDEEGNGGDLLVYITSFSEGGKVYGLYDWTFTATNVSDRRKLHGEYSSNDRVGRFEYLPDTQPKEPPAPATILSWMDGMRRINHMEGCVVDVINVDTGLHRRGLVIRGYFRDDQFLIHVDKFRTRERSGDWVEELENTVTIPLPPLNGTSPILLLNGVLHLFSDQMSVVVSPTTLAPPKFT